MNFNKCQIITKEENEKEAVRLYGQCDIDVG